MPKTTATTTTPPTDTDPHAPASGTAASDSAASDSAASDSAALDSAGHAADRREAPTSAADGVAEDSPARVARAGDVEDRVWAALRRHPGATAAELATEAPASRSAVGKLLAAWAADGSATATPGSTPRAARHWTAAPNRHATPTEPATEPATTADTAEPEDRRADEVAARTPDLVARPAGINAETAEAISQAHPDSGSDRETAAADDALREDASNAAAGAAAGKANTAEEPHRGADHEDEAARDGAKAGDPGSAEEGHGEGRDDQTRDDQTGDAEVDEADGAEVDETDDAEGDADTEVDHAEGEGTATTGSDGGAPAHRAERATGDGSGRPRTSPRTSSRTSPRTTLTRNRSGSTRLAKGALRGQVEDYLAETPGEHSPVEIGKVVGRSSGAIANALEALVESGDAVRTSDRPRRYSHCDHADDIDRTGSASGSMREGAPPARGRTRGPGRGVCGVGTYVTVLAVLPLDSTGAISTDEIANWVRARMPEPVLFASAAHGVTRAALSAGADPSHWPTTTTDSATTDGATTDGATADGTTADGTTPDDTTEGGTADDDTAGPPAGGEEQPQARVETGVGA